MHLIVFLIFRNLQHNILLPCNYLIFIIIFFPNCVLLIIIVYDFSLIKANFYFISKENVQITFIYFIFNN